MRVSAVNVAYTSSILMHDACGNWVDCYFSRSLVPECRHGENFPADSISVTPSRLCYYCTERVVTRR